MAAAAYTVKITDDFGGSSITLTDVGAAQMGPIVDELNGPGSFRFTMGINDPQAVGITIWKYEVIVLRGATVVFIGPIISIDPDPAAGTVTFGCAGPLAYFEQRNIDRGAGRINLLSNPDFETGSVGAVPTDWSEAHGPELTAGGITADVDNTDHVLGTKCVKLTQSTPGTDTFLVQVISNFEPTGIGDVVTGKAFFKISAADWIGPSNEGWGLVLKQTVVGDPTTPVGGEQSFRAADLLNSDSPRDEWVRVEVPISVAGGTNVDIEFRLYGTGVVRWDAAGAYRMESFSPRGSGGLGQDQATVAIELVSFAQGTHIDFTDVNKNDLLITANGTSCPATGVLRLLSWQFADHVTVMAALLQMTGLDDGIDFWIDMLRVFHCASPRRGTNRTATVTLTPGVNCIVAHGHVDGRSAASQIVQLGVGDGPDREEAGANDDTAFGGITLQKIVAPQGSPTVDTLQGAATRALAVAKKPTNYQAELVEPATGTDLRMVLQLGDTVTPAWNLGFVQESGVLRVVTRSLNPPTDSVTLGLNVVS